MNISGIKDKRMFTKNDCNGAVFLTVPSFERTGLVRHCITTRAGGVSEGCYSSMNFRFNCDDANRNVIENFMRISDAVGFDFGGLVLSKQMHEDIIKTITPVNRGNGILYPNEFDSADGLMTNEPGVALVTLYADCVPLLFLDPIKRVIASVHSGWRGTVARIGAKAVRKMTEDYGSRPEDILCAIGPSIRMDAFEVGDDVAGIFIENFGESVVKKYGEKYHVDMQGAIAMQLRGEGVINIDDCGICTYHNSDIFFSHRRTNGRRGNFGAIIELKG